MGQRKGLSQILLARVKKAAVKVDRRAKKPFRTLSRAHGVPKKRIKTALKGPRPGRAAKASAAIKTPPAEARDRRAAPSPGAWIALANRGYELFSQLRPTGGRTLRKTIAIIRKKDHRQ